MIASQAGRSAEIRQGDASYRPASRASGWPRTGSRPVQFGMAVRRGSGDRRHHETEQHFMDMPCPADRSGSATGGIRGAEVDQDVAATGAAALVRICVAVSDLRRLLEGNLDPRPLGTVSQRQAVIGVRIEKGPQPLDHRQLFFLQVRHHFGDEVGCGTLELRPAVGIDTILEDPRGDPTHPLRQRADDHVLVGQERRQFAAASRADEREQNRFFEGVVVDDLVERDDEFLEMLLLVLVSRVDRPPSLGADNTVLEATNQRENAEMFFVEHFSQFCQKRHRRTTALHAMQYEFAALQQCNRSPIATLGKHQSMKTALCLHRHLHV